MTVTITPKMKSEVETALTELGVGLPDSTIRTKEDSDGGAYVIVENINIGDGFEPATSWLGFHIVWSYPDADIYPYFIDAEICYTGSGNAPNQFPAGNLPEAITRGATMPGFDLPAIQISRRSNRRNADTDSALTKLLRVSEFLRTS
jgi:hypothetical protein